MDWMLLFVFISNATGAVEVQTERFATQDECNEAGINLTVLMKPTGKEPDWKCQRVTRLQQG